jgi:hypothetical protein
MIPCIFSTNTTNYFPSLDVTHKVKISLATYYLLNRLLYSTYIKCRLHKKLLKVPAPERI